MTDLSRFIGEKTSGQLETRGKTVEMGEMEIENASIQGIRGRWRNPIAGILRQISGGYRNKAKDQVVVRFGQPRFLVRNNFWTG